MKQFNLSRNKQRGFIINPYRFASGPPPGGFPIQLSVTTTVFTSVVSGHVCNFPATVTAGDLLIMHVSQRGTAANTNIPVDPTGFTLLNSTDSSGVSRGAVYYKVAAGTEGGTTVTVTSTGTTRAVVNITRIQTGTYTGTPEQAVATGSNINPDCPNLAPSWGTQNTQWLALAAQGGQVSTVTYPLASGQGVADAGGTSSVTGYRCYTDSAVPALNPGTYTTTSSLAWAAHTIAIRGT